MPDFTIEHHYVCTSVDSPGSVGGYIQELKHVPFDGPCWTCSCKAFQFQKKPIPDRCCKHLKQLFEERCAWEQFYDGGELVNDCCPKCGGTVRVEGYAV